MVGAVAHRTASWKKGISWFTKGCEALGKEKPRGIANPDELRSTLGVISAGLVEQVLCNEDREVGKFFCDRSIKHASPERLRERVAMLAERMGQLAMACGADLGAWDSRILGPIKNAIENVVSRKFVDALDMPEEIAQEVRAAREQPALRAKGQFQDISAEGYGRLSGDRGMSVFVAVEQIVGNTSSMDHHIACIISGSAGFELMLEGDGWSLVLSPQLYHGVPGWGARLGAFDREINFQWEPAAKEGFIAPLEYVFRPITEGWEFISQVWLPGFDGDGRVNLVLFLLLKKSLFGAAVTFSHSTVADSAYSGALSGTRNHSANPMMYQFFNVRRAYWSAQNGRFVADNYYTKWLKVDHGSSPERSVTDTAEWRPVGSKLKVMEAIERLYDIWVEEQFMISKTYVRHTHEINTPSRRF